MGFALFFLGNMIVMSSLCANLFGRTVTTIKFGNFYWFRRVAVRGGPGAGAAERRGGAAHGAAVQPQLPDGTALAFAISRRRASLADGNLVVLCAARFTMG